MAKDKPSAAAATRTTHLKVRALVAGFRRAGRAWPAEAVIVPVDAFTAEQIAQMRGDPMLVVEDASA